MSEKVQPHNSDESQRPDESGVVRGDAESKYLHKVDGLARRVLTDKINIKVISMVEEGEERERIMMAVQRRILVVYASIQSQFVKHGNASMLPALRRRMAELFNLEEEQFPPSPEKIEGELINHGIVYLSGKEPDFFASTLLLIETKFIARCENLKQQNRIIQIVNSIKREDLVYLGRLGGMLIYRLNQAILNILITSTWHLEPENPAVPQPESGKDSYWEWGDEKEW